MPRGPQDNPQAAMPMEGRRDNGRASRAGPRAHAGGHPAQDSVPGFMGCLKGKSALLMSGKACEPQVEVRKQGVQKWAVMTESPGAIQD